MENLNDESQMRRDTSAVATYPEGAQSYRYAVEDSSAGPAAVVSDKSAAAVNEADNIPMPVRVPKPRRQKDTSAEVDMSSTEDLTAAGGGSEDAGKAGTEENVPRKKRRRPKPTAGSEEEGAALMSAAEPLTDSAAVQPSPGETRRLKVHIKAQPGAAVHIQNAPPVAPKPAYRPPKAHNTSTETDI